MGLMSKNKTGALSTEANILLWSTLDAFTQTKKNRIARAKFKIMAATVVPA